jgi:hypothetical protein
VLPPQRRELREEILSAPFFVSANLSKMNVTSSIYKFRPEKPCFNCGKVYKPMKRGTMTEEEISNKDYVTNLFCSKECDDAYVSGAIKSNAMPQAVSQIIDVEDAIKNANKRRRLKRRYEQGNRGNAEGESVVVSDLSERDSSEGE